MTDTEMINKMADKIAKLEEQADKYRWHNLREFPDDLPDDNSNVLVWQIGLKGRFCYWALVYKNGSFYSEEYRMGKAEIFKWKYIEPVESEE